MSYRRHKSTVLALLAGSVLVSLAGCGETVRNVAQVHPPVIAAPVVHEPLPVQLPLDPDRARVPQLIVVKPDGISMLAASSRAAFDTGEQDFQAGRLGKAREEFDVALDQLLSSGFDLDADPRLSDLYHHIVETVNADELEAFRAGDGFQEQKAAPAPIDEIAEGAIPEEASVDPNLRGRAEHEVTSISHDLPLTVNDPVLSF